jgi:hypothetical protein
MPGVASTTDPERALQLIGAAARGARTPRYALSARYPPAVRRDQGSERTAAGSTESADPAQVTAGFRC